MRCGCDRWNATRRFLAVATLLCTSLNGSAINAKVRPIPKDGFEPALHEALATSDPGDEILLPAGRFYLERDLHLAVHDVAVRGEGKSRTVLDFSRQKMGAQSWLVMANDISIEGLRLLDPPADGLVVRGARGITIKDVAVEWTGPPQSSNGGYGIYPVNSSDVLIDDCYARGASEAGIYVGQSYKGVIRNNVVEENVSGLDIENSTEIVAEHNVVRGNSMGIVVSARPGLLQPRSFEVEVRDNLVSKNNLTSFANKGAFLSNLGDGVGIVVVGGSRTRLSENELNDHRRTQILLLSYSSLDKQAVRDPYFSPNLDQLMLSGNQLHQKESASPARSGSWRDAIGFDVVWDGVTAAVPAGGRDLLIPICRRKQVVEHFLATNKMGPDNGFEAVVPDCSIGN